MVVVGTARILPNKPTTLCVFRSTQGVQLQYDPFFFEDSVSGGSLLDSVWYDLS